MSENLSKHTLGLTQLQSGQGSPSHVALKGSLYIDVLTSEYYKNTDGNVGWLPLVVSATTGFDTYVTGFTYDNQNKLTLSQNNGEQDINVYLNQFSGLTINGIISATTYYGDGSNLTGLVTNDFYVTGGTFVGDTLTLDRQNGSVVITGFTFSSLDTYVTGFTYSNNNLTINQNGGQPDLIVNIDVMSGLTINGSLSATTYLGLPIDPDNYVTGGTYSNGTLTLDRQNGSVVVTGITNNNGGGGGCFFGSTNGGRGGRGGDGIIIINCY